MEISIHSLWRSVLRDQVWRSMFGAYWISCIMIISLYVSLTSKRTMLTNFSWSFVRDIWRHCFRLLWHFYTYNALLVLITLIIEALVIFVLRCIDIIDNTIMFFWCSIIHCVILTILSSFVPIPPICPRYWCLEISQQVR